MKIILPEEELKQLEEIGHVSLEQLNTMLEDQTVSLAEREQLHEVLKDRGVIITEEAPPHLPRHPLNSEADPHVINETEELNA